MAFSRLSLICTYTFDIHENACFIPKNRSNQAVYSRFSLTFGVRPFGRLVTKK